MSLRKRKFSKPTPRSALADVFASPSEDEDFEGFRSENPSAQSESGDSLQSEDSGKAELSFRSKYITDKLVRIFMDTDSEEEFEGFTVDANIPRRAPKRAKSVESEEASDEDTGFYSEGEEPLPPRRSSGLCVAFRFPTKKSSAHQPQRAALRPEQQPRGMKAAGRGRAAEMGVAPSPRGRALRDFAKAEECWDKNLCKDPKECKNEEDGLAEAEAQVLSKRDRNIQENKAMLAKLFADLQAMEQISPLTTPKKKKAGKRKSSSDVQFERRNPSRKARPRDHFGIEEVLPKPDRQPSIKRVSLMQLLEVDENARRRKSPKQRRSKVNCSYLPVEDITQEVLDNVADRAKDKILDKDRGSTCHQCRQKTLDTKTVCRSLSCVGVKGQFCGPCLRNRYGEDVRTALLDPTWECPLCRGMCNCSLCRKREGRCATGNLANLAKHYGHGSVREYLESLQKQL